MRWEDRISIEANDGRFYCDNNTRPDQKRTARLLILVFLVLANFVNSHQLRSEERRKQKDV